MHIRYVCERVGSSVCMCVCACTCPYCVFVFTVRAPLLIASSFACFLLAAERFLGGREVGIERAPLPWTTLHLSPAMFVTVSAQFSRVHVLLFHILLPQHTHNLTLYTQCLCLVSEHISMRRCDACGCVCTGVVTSRSPVST